LQEVKPAQGVRAVLEGSVRMSGRAVRISAQLTDVDSGYNVWSRSYDRELTDIFAVQDDITAEIVQALQIQLDDTAARRLLRPPVDTDLYQLMLRGRYHWNQRTPEGFALAEEYFNKAIADYPDYGPAYAGLADVYLSQFDYGLISWSESTEKARMAATTALELDANLAEPHASLAHLHLHEWRWQLAESAFLRAIEIDPNYVVARHWYALCLTATGRAGEAVRAMEKAQQLDPLSVRINADLGMAYLAAGRYDEAVAQENRTLQLAPQSATPRWIRGMALEQMGNFAEAETDMRVVLDAWQRDASIVGSLGHLLAISGKQDEARALRAELVSQADTTDVTFFAALIDVGLGDTDAAFEWLNRAVESRSGSARYLMIDVRLDPLRGDARFAQLLTRVGLGADQLARIASPP
jgi:Flp pilus assembly protein TadD